jgi:predicted ATPase
MPLKILITGAFSTGKTTLVSEVRVESARQGLEIATVGDVARSCPLPLNREQTLLSSLWLLGTQVANESLTQSKQPSIAVICDRGVPDIVSHTVEVAPCTSSQHYLSIFVSMAKSWAQTYDRILWARPDPAFGIESDGLRIVDSSYRRALDLRMPAVFQSLGVHSQELPPNLEDRVEMMLQLITSVYGR